MTSYNAIKEKERVCMFHKYKNVSVIPLLFLFIILFIQPFSVDATDQKSTIPPPQVVGKEVDEGATGKGGNGNDEIPGEWYVGATPPNLNEDAPVLLFVPGLNNTAQVWWKNNDMYETAYEAGYQTAFIQLYDAGGASADMWDNGRLLAEKTQEISTYFAGQDIAIVAYSKGGVDTQTALTYYGGSDVVTDVITLSSPHHGSQLADLAYSYWAGWLAELLGMRGEGTYVMETGYMEHFRSMIDEHPNAHANDYFTFGGVDWGPLFSATWFGGVYLSSYGENDGVVTAASSKLPRGHEVAIDEWNHVSIRTGIMFSEIEQIVTEQSLNKATNDSYVHSTKTMANITEINQAVIGGPLHQNDTNEVLIAVEDQVERVTLNLITADEMSEIRFIDPKGKTIVPEIETVTEENPFFPRAYQLSITLEKPTAGQWRLNIETVQENAYLLVTEYEVEREGALLKEKAVQGEKLLTTKQLNSQLEALSNQVQEHTLAATYYVQESGKPENTKVYNVKGSADLSQQLQFDEANKVYTITVDVKGKTKAGFPFQRTVIDSVYVK